VLTTSPATIPSPPGRRVEATTASPVLTAMRTCRSSAGCLVQLLDRVADASAAARRARVVLVRDGRAEDGHDRVADELLHRAAEALDLRRRRA
jgi:hypothetical protein